MDGTDSTHHESSHALLRVGVTSSTLVSVVTSVNAPRCIRRYARPTRRAARERLLAQRDTFDCYCQGKHQSRCGIVSSVQDWLTTTLSRSHTGRRPSTRVNDLTHLSKYLYSQSCLHDTQQAEVLLRLCSSHQQWPNSHTIIFMHLYRNEHLRLKAVIPPLVV